MKTMILAAALLSLGAATFAPAYAEGEGNGEPFPMSVTLGRTAPSTYTQGYGHRDVGSAQYPDVTGNPGSNLSALANNEVLPAQSNESIIQTANSLPRGFEEGTVAYAQAKSINAWMVAHNKASPSSVASR